MLVTNDDGVTAAGIDTLVTALETLPDVDVAVVAPADDKTGTGGMTTAGRLTTTDATTASGHPAKGVDGFPADTIRAAIEDLGLEVDLVVSGINAGQNLGSLVNVSGTVGAARAASAAGIPALAVSQGIGDPFDYPAALPYVLDWVRERRQDLIAGTVPDAVANMNVPSCPAGEVRGLREEVLDADATAGLVVPQDCTSTSDPAGDVAAFNAGYATLTAPLPDP
ncbi:MAG: 5'/3'-nucleotidase SurE [Acidimicrobiales bacterium]